MEVQSCSIVLRRSTIESIFKNQYVNEQSITSKQEKKKCALLNCSSFITPAVFIGVRQNCRQANEYIGMIS